MVEALGGEARLKLLSEATQAEVEAALQALLRMRKQAEAQAKAREQTGETEGAST